MLGALLASAEDMAELFKDAEGAAAFAREDNDIITPELVLLLVSAGGIDGLGLDLELFLIPDDPTGGDLNNPLVRMIYPKIETILDK